MDNTNAFSGAPRPRAQAKTFDSPGRDIDRLRLFDDVETRPARVLPRLAVVTLAAAFGVLAVLALNIHSPYLALAVAGPLGGSLLLWAVRWTTRDPLRLVPALVLVETLPYVNLIPLDPEKRWWLHYPLLLAFCLPSIAAAYHRGVLRERYLAVFLVYFGWGAVSVIYSLDPLISAGRLLPAALLFAALTLVSLSTVSAKDMDAVLWNFLVGCAVLLCLTAFVAVALPRRVFIEGSAWAGTWRAAHDMSGTYTWIRDTSGIDRFEGVFYSPNQVGSLVFLSIGVALSLWGRASRRQRIVLVLIILAGAVFGVMADSRSPIVALAIGVGAYLLWQHRTRGMLVCAAVALAGMLVYGALGTTARLGVSRNVGTLTGRTLAWKFELRKIVERPLTGYGYDVEGAIFKDPRFPSWDSFWSQGPRTSTHEGYLSIAVGLGVPALVFWLYIILRPWIALLRRSGDPWNLKPLFFFLILPSFCRAFAETGIGDVHGMDAIIFYLLWMVAERQRVMAPPTTLEAAADSLSARDPRRMFAGAAALVLLLILTVALVRPASASDDAAGERVLTLASRVDGYFPTLPPHAVLPSGRQCAAEIPPTPETIPGNIPFNRTVATPSELAAFRAAGYTFETLASHAQYARIKGNYTGSTDMIMRWVACKYGIDENVVRGQAWAESFWRQWATGDRRTTRAECVQDGFTALWDTTIFFVDGRKVSCPHCCYTSWSAWQTKVYYEWKTWPMIKDSTSFAAEYRFADTRACINGDWKPYFARRPAQPGHNTYAEDVALYANNPSQANLDTLLWGCIGMHYSGGWYDPAAVKYIDNIKGNIAHKRWLTPNIHITGW